jgi:hypothetical protein
VPAGNDLPPPPHHIAPPRELKDATREKLLAMQEKAQHEVKRYEDVVSVATTVLGERRQ